MRRRNHFSNGTAAISLRIPIELYARVIKLKADYGLEGSELYRKIFVEGVEKLEKDATEMAAKRLKSDEETADMITRAFMEPVEASP